MKRILGIVPLLFFVLAGCNDASEQSHNQAVVAKNSSLESHRLKENIGWIHGKCLVIRNGDIKPGTPVQIVLLNKPQQLMDGRAVGVAKSGPDCPPLLNDRAEINKQDGRFFYRLDMGKELLDAMALGFVFETVQVRRLKSGVEFDLNHDGVMEHAGTCLTSEGMQFYISSNATFDDKAEWSDYYYLGYDSKPTCP